MPGILRSHRRAAIALAVLAAAGGIAGLVVAVVTPASYVATGTVFVATSGTSTSLSELPAVDRPIGTAYSGLATSAAVLEPVITELGLRSTVDALARRIHATQPDEQPVLEIEVSDPSAAGAARIANAVQDRLVSEVSSLAPTSPGQTVVLRSVRRATPPTAPAGPPALVLVLLGALAGVLMWAVAAIVVLIARTPTPAPGAPAPSMF